jgi:hypothetical protein
LSEAKIQSEILLAFGATPHMRIWRNNSGLLWAPGPGGTMRRVRASAEGAPDIIGLLRGGLFIGIECKAEHGRQSPQQLAFQKMIGKMGGLYMIARSVEDVRRQLPEGWNE